MNIAVVLCMGGNDYLPNFHSFTHSKILQKVLDKSCLLQLIIFMRNDDGFAGGFVDAEVYTELIKSLYCPAGIDASRLTSQQVRQHTVRPCTSKSQKNNTCHKWMPPDRILDQVRGMIDWQIAYLFTAGSHSSNLPPDSGCWSLFSNDFDVRVESPEDLLVFSQEELKEAFFQAELPVKRRQDNTPQKGQRRKKRVVSSTPKKSS